MTLYPVLLRCTSLAAIMLLAACGNGAGPGDPDLCPQTFEFGNFGCARVAGTVRDGGGQPLGGVSVTLAPPVGGTNAFDSPSARTGADGSFALEAHRFDQPAVLKGADTIPMYLRGALMEEPTVRDSILLTVIVVPVDSIAQTVEADLVLAQTP
jgi:hypothetical protein